MTTGLPVTRRLDAAYVGSLIVGLGIVVVSAIGLASSTAQGDGSLVLISRGADVANLVVVLPVLLATMRFAHRGSVIGLVLWPGALFYVTYAYVPYLVGAPFSGLFFGYVLLVTLSALTLIGVVASLDLQEIARRLAAAPAHTVGAGLVVVALLAYAGLAGQAIAALADPASEIATRPLSVADWALGTPVLLVGGVLLWLRLPLGYVVAPALLLVSGLGGVVFAIAAVVDNVLAVPQTEPAVIVVHLVIAAISFAFLAFFVRRAHARRAADPLTATPSGRPTAGGPTQRTMPT